MSSVRLSSESSDGIPVLDLFAAKEDECAAAATIRQACTTAGFFSVCNHGVSQDLIDSTFSKSRDFFRQPRKAKESCRVDHNSRGWTPLGEETLDPATQSRGDTKEGFYIGREVAADSDEGQLPLQGPNNWPDEERWPALAGWREHMMEYHTALYCRVSCTCTALFKVDPWPPYYYSHWSFCWRSGVATLASTFSA
eukprot:m.390748 g.390748  ORF g.390748 m.390748 type:complete len:196 (-) comp21063_c0_seq6:175-762(-)